MRNGERWRVFPLHRKQLIQRIQLHELDAGVSEDIGSRHHLEQILLQPLGARIAIMPRHIEQQSVSAEQPIIDTPGIHANPIERQLTLAHRDIDPVLDLMPETQCVPIERSLNAHRSIREAMEFRNLELAVNEAAE